MRNQTAKHDRQNQARHADRRGFGYFPNSKAVHVPSHDKRQRDAAADGEDTPGAFLQRVDDSETQARERDDDNEENRNRGDESAERPDFLTGNFNERFSATTRG